MNRTAARWAVYVGVAVLFAIACAYLSNWQFSRNAWRSDQLALIDANYDAVPVALGEILPEGQDFSPADEWRPVTVTGEYLADDQLLARNRAHGGSAAYEVLVPFRLDDGRMFLIDRGWEPPGGRQPEPDSIPAPPDGRVTVVARLQPSEDLPSSGRTAPDGQVPSINLPLVASVLDDGVGDRLEQSAYGQLAAEDPAPAETPKTFEEPSVDPGPYLSYAIQWILFAVMGFVFIGYVIRSERARRREDAAALAAGDAGAAASVRRPRKRTDRDAEDEDALLDSARR